MTAKICPVCGGDLGHIVLWEDPTLYDGALLYYCTETQKAVPRFSEGRLHVLGLDWAAKVNSQRVVVTRPEGKRSP
jgi:hypothetical protein